MRRETDPDRGTRPDERSAEVPERVRAETGNGNTLRDRMTRAGTQPEDGAAVTSWQDIKSRFVDDPAGAIAAAERLVQQAVEDRIRALRDEAAAVCAPDGDGDDASSTETLRTRLLRYQQLCERLAGAAVH